MINMVNFSKCTFYVTFSHLSQNTKLRKGNSLTIIAMFKTFTKWLFGTLVYSYRYKVYNS